MAKEKIDSLSSSETLSSLGTSSSLGDLGLSEPRASSNLTNEELLMIAKSRGGAVGEIAETLVHPEKSILSTVWDGFKNAFSGFIDIVSLPSQVAAGVISTDFTVEEAIKEKLRVSDVIFGDSNIFDKDGNLTTMEKIGDFVVRLPTDILTDPTTYLTFGATAGVLGLRSLPKVSLGAKGIAELGIGAKAAKAGGVASRRVTKEGADLLKFATNLERKAKAQLNGTLTLKKLPKLEKFGKELKEKLIKQGVDEDSKVYRRFFRKRIKRITKIYSWFSFWF